ncbi:MAG: diguanylate cyclase [Methylococcaceae bacterium]|nr:diguanylate cyclase [Methylococcaceae bacterium]
MKEYIIKSGALKAVIIITAFSTLFSVMITAFSMSLLNADQTMIDASYVIATITPLIITPIIASMLVNLIIKTHALESEMRELATIDFLTSLMTRREWIKQAEKYINLASRNKSHYAVIMIDIDDFKRINDQFGHFTGDKVLVSFGQTIKNVCRTSDLSARFGGEEFVILLPDTSLDQAKHFTERLHNETRSLIIPDKNKTLSFTISIGVSMNTPYGPCNFDALISQADTALYQAKHQGKNTTSVFQH